MQNLAPCGLPDQFVEGRSHSRSEGTNDVPLSRGRQRNLKIPLQALQSIDEVAYVRFASVYRRFQDITEFEDEIKRPQKISETAANREQMSLLPELLGKKDK